LPSHARPALDRLWGILLHTMALRRRRALGFAFGVAAFLVALCVRFLLDPVLRTGFPFLTFFPAIVLTTFLTGALPGLLCALLSTFAAWFWFIPPAGSFALDLQSTIAILFFVLVAAVDIVVIDLMNTATARLAEERRTTLQLLEQRTVLFQELQHRVANNLQFVVGLLALQSRRLAHNPEASEALDNARRRFDMMSRVHRSLYDPQSAELPLRERIEGLCAEVADLADAPGIEMQVRCADTAFDVETTLTLSLVVIELVTNAVKHAFGAGGGTVRVALDRTSDGGYLLEVADDGRGMPEDFDPAASTRLGFRVLRGLAVSLGGEIRFEALPQGTAARLPFRA
jgi:two-component sensor histidine kinase